MSFSERLRAARKKAGLTQQRLAEKSGLATGTIQQYELNKRTPKPEAVAKIAEALDLGYSYTKDGEPYFYDFVDTVQRPEYAKNEKFNNIQYKDAQRIIEPYERLNDIGKNEAIKRVEELTELKKYAKDTKE